LGYGQRHYLEGERREQSLGLAMLVCFTLAFTGFVIFGADAWAGSQLPGEDASDKLEAAGTLLRLIDTGLFKWGARVLSAVCIMSAGWALKEQRFGISVICIIGAIVLGTVPTWVKNIFEVGGNQSLFSQVEVLNHAPRVAEVYPRFKAVGWPDRIRRSSTMHDYSTLKRDHGNKVSQTIDSPILIFDFWELSDAFLALAIILIFGVVFYTWGIMFVLLILSLGVVPFIKRRNERGIFFHWPYRKFGLSLPGLVNPRGTRKFSD
jgi:hypothetical protein